MTDGPKNADNKAERQLRYKRGQRSEFWAMVWLKFKGYHILARRHRTPVGEIDIIARKHNTVSFIEVKRRGTIDLAASSIPHHQRKRIARAALYWIGKNKSFEQSEMSLDVILIAPFKLPVHIKGAFAPEG